MFLSVFKNWVYLLLFLGALVCMFSFVLSSARFLKCLIVLEKMNVLLLVGCLLLGSSDNHVYFVAFIVMFTVEVVLGLCVLTRVWGSGTLVGSVGW